MSTKIIVEAPSAQSAMERWIARGDAIGVFSNHDLSSANVGHKVFLPITNAERSSCIIGKTRAPDHHSYGLGWRYLLDEIATSIDRFEFRKAGAE